MPDMQAYPGLQCSWCREPIYLGQQSVYLEMSTLQTGKKSGQPVASPDPEFLPGNVHNECAIEWLKAQLFKRGIYDPDNDPDCPPSRFYDEDFECEITHCDICDVEIPRQPVLCPNCESELDPNVE